MKPESLFHWEIEVVAKLATLKPVEVAMYPLLLFHWEIEVVAKLAVVKPVEVVRKVDEFTPCQVPVQFPPVEVTPRFVKVMVVPEATTPR
jgi:hypothetical protein